MILADMGLVADTARSGFVGVEHMQLMQIIGSVSESGLLAYVGFGNVLLFVALVTKCKIRRIYLLGIVLRRVAVIQQGLMGASVGDMAFGAFPVCDRLVFDSGTFDFIGNAFQRSVVFGFDRF